MRDANDLLHQLHSQGLAVRIREDGLLGVTPAERLTDDTRALLREYREALLDLLWAEPHPSDGREIGWT